MGTVTIRRLEPGDAAAWAGLRREALEAHPLAFGSAPPDDPGELVTSAQARMAAEDSVIVGAWVDAALVGIVGVRREFGPKERHKAFVWGMYVVAQYRQLGIGARLLQAALDETRAWPGVQQVHLSVSSVASEARRLYEQQGFRVWGVEPRALGWNGEYADELHMVRDLHDGDEPSQAPIGLR